MEGAMRQGVSYETVAAAADRLRAQGIRPTLRAVRAEIGTGSLTTIQNHLARHTGSLPVTASTVTRTLPDSIQQAIMREIEQAEAACRASMETELAEARDTITQLTGEGERLETDLSERDAELAAAGRERDALAVRLAEAEREIARLRVEVTEERRTLENTRLELARASILAAETTQLRAELGTAEKETETLREKSIRLESALEFERQTTASLRDRISHLEKAEASIRQMFETERTRTGEEFRKVRDELSSAGEDRVRLETMLSSEKKQRESLEQERTGLQETIRSLRLEVQKREVEEAVRAATQKKNPHVSE